MSSLAPGEVTDTAKRLRALAQKAYNSKANNVQAAPKQEFDDTGSFAGQRNRALPNDGVVPDGYNGPRIPNYGGGGGSKIGVTYPNVL